MNLAGRSVAELEIQHAKAGMEALVVHHLGRLRMQVDSGQQGPSPENFSEAMSLMMADIAEEDKADADVPLPGPEAEPTDGSTA